MNGGYRSTIRVQGDGSLSSRELVLHLIAYICLMLANVHPYHSMLLLNFIDHPTLTTLSCWVSTLLQHSFACRLVCDRLMVIAAGTATATATATASYGRSHDYSFGWKRSQSGGWSYSHTNRLSCHMNILDQLNWPLTSTSERSAHDWACNGTLHYFCTQCGVTFLRAGTQLVQHSGAT